jgi:chemotaxis signal transduction protein
MTTTKVSPAPREPSRLTPIRPMGIVIPVTTQSAPTGVRQTSSQRLRDRVRAREGLVDVLLFRAGREMFALELVEVEEALDLPELNAVPEMSRDMRGVMPLRGSLIATYAPDALLGVSSGALRTVLVLRGRDRRVALAVEDVEDVATLPLSELRDPPIVEKDGLLLGVFSHDAQLVGLLDAELVIAACRSEIALESK